MRRIAAMVAFLALVIFTSGAQSVYKIGAHWPLADQGSVEASKAAQLAVDEINKAGGVLGHQLQLIVVDDEGNGAKGVAAVEKLMTVDKVDLLFGGYSSGVEAALVPTLKKYGVVTVATGAASSAAVENALGPSPGSDFYFHLHPWDYNQGMSYAQGWRDIQAKYANVKIKKVFLAYEEGAFGQGSWAGLKTQYGDQYQYDGASFKSALMGGSDYSGVLQAAKDFNPDLFIWAGYAPDAQPLMEQAKAMKFNPPIFLGAPPAWPADIGSSPLTENVMSYGMWAAGLNDKNPLSKKFYDAYVKAYGVAPTGYFAALSYSGIYILANAIKTAGGLDKDRLIAALEKTKYPSALGETITFSPSNVIKHQGIRNQKILQWQNGRQQIIWPFEYSTTTIVFPMPPWK
ncbi:MAG TPA: ABC transporter substrate-binding protein [Rectinemataceae bacterium]|nr:ABC transporter substrate-binding protein [Rectinemataceae bacterium]